MNSPSHPPVQKMLDPLVQQLLRMGHLAEGILDKSLRSVWERNASFAREVAADDLDIDRLDVEIDQAALEFLALRAPVAQDLRRVIAIKMAATDLERVGDLARNIAKSAIRLSELNSGGVPPILKGLAGLSQRILRRALQSFADHDQHLARAVLASDDEVDSLEEEFFARALDAIRANSETSEQQIHYLLIAKNLERVADHGTNIAEETILVVESVNLKHAEKLET